MGEVPAYKYRIIQGEERGKEQCLEHFQIPRNTQPTEWVSSPAVVEFRAFNGINAERLPENNVALIL